MQITIVGAGYAGLACALRLAARTRGAARVTLINASELFIERIRLHEQVAGREPRAVRIDHMLRGTGVHLRVGRVEHIDIAGHSLSIAGDLLHWDRLVLALGSQVDTSQVAGVREHAYTLDAASAAWLVPALPALAARRAQLLVVGGGLTGIEVASEIAEAYPALRVKLVTRGELAPGFSSSARAHVRAAFTRLGVELREQVAVRALRAKAVLHDGEPIPFDACIWAAGFAAPPLARQAGLEVNARGQAWADRDLRATAHPHVYLAGDVAALREPQGAPVPMGCKSALPSGLHVAEGVARALRRLPERPFAYRTLPFCVSLGRNDALLELPNADRDARMVIKGKLAAHLKELICRGTLWSLELERLRACRPLRVRWPRWSLPSRPGTAS